MGRRNVRAAIGEVGRVVEFWGWYQDVGLVVLGMYRSPRGLLISSSSTVLEMKHQATEAGICSGWRRLTCCDQHSKDGGWTLEPVWNAPEKHCLETGRGTSLVAPVVQVAGSRRGGQADAGLCIRSHGALGWQ
jgi:hypothetical protein